MVERRDQAGRGVVVGADLDADGALRHGRQHHFRRHRGRDVLRQSQSIEAGAGQERRIGNALLQLAQPRLHVAAEADDAQVGTRAQHLRLAARR